MANDTPDTGDLLLTNTMTRKKERFTSRFGKTVKVFTCGPSIYRRPHLGNYRTFLYEDILVRFLEYAGYEVNRTISITDIEDKSISEAKKENKSVHELISPVIATFQREAAMLRIKLPDILPRASTSMDEVVHLLQTLLGKGYAYNYHGNIYFEPKKFRGFGRLYGLDMSRWPKKTVRYSLDTYPGQRWNLGDFILWHGWEGQDTTYWDTPIGKGRPSWNIQDPAIIMKYLGPAIDIHCGGIDNIYRHHDYNIAVMEAASGQELAPFWLHGEHLIVDGKKMSKETGNVVYPEDLVAKGYTPEEIRFFLVYGRYRKKKNLTAENLDGTTARLRETRRLLSGIYAAGNGTASPEALRLAGDIEPRFRTAMNDDLDVRKAFDDVTAAVRSLSTLARKGQVSAAVIGTVRGNIRRIDGVLNIFHDP